MFFATAQEEILSDSISKKHPELLIKQPGIERSLILDAIIIPNEINALNYTIFDQPLLPVENKNLDFLRYLNPSKQVNLSYSFLGTSFNPIYPFGRVFNQSAYRLNDRLLIGGNSFGAQSIFDQPKLNSSIQDMSIKGASMFMQYKVSDHFKVETRVSISNGRSIPWEP